jgi:hypothetical protein
MGSKADYLENKILDHVLKGTTYTAPSAVYSALFTVIPSDSTGGTEVTTASSGYTRVATTFSSGGATVTGQSVNTGAVTFTTAAAAYTVVGWGLLDAATAGNLLYWATVTTLAIAINDQATFAVGGIVITED